MSAKTRHLLHLAALMLLLYFFALSAEAFGATVAFAIFFPLGILVEIRFWWVALWKRDPPGSSQG